jgi:CRP-like cAMP-binding protein
MSAVADHLRHVPLFEGMTDSAIAAVAAIAVETAYSDGQTIVTEGEAGDAFYVVTAGRVRITREGAEIASLDAGSFLGEVSLLDGRPRTATATAVGPVETLVIGREAFLRLLDERPAVRLSVLMALTARIRRDERDEVL